MISLLDSDKALPDCWKYGVQTQSRLATLVSPCLTQAVTQLTTGELGAMIGELGAMVGELGAMIGELGAMVGELGAMTHSVCFAHVAEAQTAYPLLPRRGRIP